MNHKSKFKIISQKCSSQCLCQNCLNRIAAANRMTDRSLDKKCILLNFWSNCQKIHRNAPHSDLYQNCLNVVATPNKLTARAVDKKYLQAASSLNHWYTFKNDFTHMFIIRPSGKICTIGSALLNKMATRTK